MRFSDILGMSLTNLWKRKMRTVLTVLGVVIGTASIVVMLSLGIGLKQASLEQVESAGGLTEIWVYSDSYDATETTLLDESTIDLFEDMDFVESVDPQLIYYMPIQVGNYEGYVELVGVSQKYMHEIELGKGTYPEKSNTLNVIAGNQIIADLTDMKTGEWIEYESEEDIDVDLMAAPIIGGVTVEETYEPYVEEEDEELSGYYNPDFSDVEEDDFSSDSDFSDYDEDSEDDYDDDEEDSENSYLEDDDSDDLDETYEDDTYDEEEIYSYFDSETKRVQLQVTGITEGDLDTYTDYSDYCYADMDLLKDFLKKNYSENEVIPGQPTDREGKPYRDLKYSQLIVKVDEADNVETVLEEIQSLGYQADANKEWLEDTEKQFMIIEAVFGGIGAVAMLVAAISIANTMTMSIYERTKEIGVMKVLGCGLGNIRSMFLTEAAFIGLIGGIVGLGLSYLLSLLLNKLVAPYIMYDYGSNVDISVIPLWLVAMAIGFSTIVGMLAGFFPAQRATRLSPLAAIRNE